MTLPTLVKTWQFSVNQTIPVQADSLATHRKMLRALKDSLIGFASNPWTVRYSCDSAVAGAAGDGVDRWAADTNLVWNNAGSAHSWIVLKQAGLATNFQLLLSCEGADGAGKVLKIVVSPSAGFTGGSTTARPTATDEQVILNGTVWEGSFTSNVQFVLHVMQSSDGQCTRWFIHSSNILYAVVILDKPANTHANWTIPWMAVCVSNVFTPAAAYGAFTNTGTAPIVSAFGAIPMTLWLSVEGVSSTLTGLPSLLTAANSISGEWPLFSMGLVSNTASAKGKHGSVADLFYGLLNAGEGDTYPDDGSKQFVHFGDFVHPWNGTTLVTL